jgi:hypothetical protein
VTIDLGGNDLFVLRRTSARSIAESPVDAGYRGQTVNSVIEAVTIAAEGQNRVKED